MNQPDIVVRSICPEKCVDLEWEVGQPPGLEAQCTPFRQSEILIGYSAPPRVRHKSCVPSLSVYPALAGAQDDQGNLVSMGYTEISVHLSAQGTLLRPVRDVSSVHLSEQHTPDLEGCPDFQADTVQASVRVFALCGKEVR